MPAAGPHPRPKELTRANQHDLKVIWSDGHESIYPSRPLRLACPCAGCVDEVTGAIIVLPGNVPADVHPMGVRLVGRYGVALDWSDGHRTGIYTFDLLRRACPCCQAKLGSRPVDEHDGAAPDQSHACGGAGHGGESAGSGHSGESGAGRGGGCGGGSCGGHAH